jgi:hypothetical protein
MSSSRREGDRTNKGRKVAPMSETVASAWVSRGGSLGKRGRGDIRYVSICDQGAERGGGGGRGGVVFCWRDILTYSDHQEGARLSCKMQIVPSNLAETTVWNDVQGLATMSRHRLTLPSYNLPSNKSQSSKPSPSPTTHRNALIAESVKKGGTKPHLGIDCQKAPLQGAHRRHSKR